MTFSSSFVTTLASMTLSGASSSFVMILAGAMSEDQLLCYTGQYFGSRHDVSKSSTTMLTRPTVWSVIFPLLYLFHPFFQPAVLHHLVSCPQERLAAVAFQLTLYVRFPVFWP